MNTVSEANCKAPPLLATWSTAGWSTADDGENGGSLPSKESQRGDLGDEGAKCPADDRRTVDMKLARRFTVDTGQGPSSRSKVQERGCSPCRPEFQQQPSSHHSVSSWLDGPVASGANNGSNMLDSMVSSNINIVADGAAAELKSTPKGLPLGSEGSCVHRAHPAHSAHPAHPIASSPMNAASRRVPTAPLTLPSRVQRCGADAMPPMPPLGMYRTEGPSLQHALMPSALPPPLPPRVVPPLPGSVAPWQVNRGDVASRAAPRVNTRGLPARGSRQTPLPSWRAECPVSSTHRSAGNNGDAEPRESSVSPIKPANTLPPLPRHHAAHEQSASPARPAASCRPAPSNQPASSNGTRRFLESFGTQVAFMRPNASTMLKKS